MAQITINIDDDVKQTAEKVCAEMGLSLSTAITIYLKKLGREKRIPFEISIAPMEPPQEKAENTTQRVQVCGVRPLANYQLWIRFNTGEAKIFDFRDLLDSPAFSPLKDQAVFDSVTIDYGVTVWKNGKIDIAPEYLYEHGLPADDTPNT